MTIHTIPENDDVAFERECLRKRTWRPARPRGNEWAPLDTAPKDGTVFEMCCCYGPDPWTQKYHWSDTFAWDDGRVGRDPHPTFRSYPDGRSRVIAPSTCFWRPLPGVAHATAGGGIIRHIIRHIIRVLEE